MPHRYSMWLGRQVTLQVEAGGLRAPIRGLVVSESSNALRVRVGGRWDVDIFKEMVARVEEDKIRVFDTDE